MGQKRPHVARPHLDRLDDRCLLSGGPAGLTPAQITQAYGLAGLKFGATSLTGAGQTIAIIDAYTNPNLARELALFDAQFKLTPLTVSGTIGTNPNVPTLTQVNMATGPNAARNTNAGWSQEEALDVEWAHAIAPGANILVVEAASPTTASLMAAVAYAESQKGVSVVSMSWSEPESRADEAKYDSDFNKSGITFIASSGDSGPKGATQWPASSSYVISVGGTSLQIGTSATGVATYVGETTWAGSQGGLSAFEKEPAFQAAVQSTGMRSTPDVAFVADPNTGVAVLYIAPNASATSAGTWLVVGGTSVGAPAWAGIIALIDQRLALANLASLSSTQALTNLYTLASASPGDFHGIVPVMVTTGAGFGFGGRFSGAQETADAYTGLGTLDGVAFVEGLVAEDEGVAPASNPSATPAGPFNGLHAPKGGATTGGGAQGTGTKANQGGAQGGNTGGNQGGGGWWSGWWFFDAGAFGGPAREFAPFVSTTSGPGAIGGLTSTRTGASNVAPAQGKLTAPPPLMLSTSPFAAASLPAAAGLPGAFGLLAPVVAPNPATLVPLQNVPNLGSLFDEALDRFVATRLWFA